MTANVYHVENTQKDKKVDEKAKIPLSQITTESMRFQLIFLKDDEYQSVEVLEVAEIDFEEVLRRISKGESVFITRKHMQELDLSTDLDETFRDPWYFTHI
jgi:hypothetical protein